MLEGKLSRVLGRPKAQQRKTHYSHCQGLSFSSVIRVVEERQKEVRGDVGE